MKKTPFIYLLSALVCVLSLASCGPKVIPAHKMEKVYEDVLVADQWLKANPDAQRKADTTYFYAPVLEKYGYSVEDFKQSLLYYIAHPKKFSAILEKVEKNLDERTKQVINDEKIKMTDENADFNGEVHLQPEEFFFD